VVSIGGGCGAPVGAGVELDLEAARAWHGTFDVLDAGAGAHELDVSGA
jgi:hypothetical protein